MARMAAMAVELFEAHGYAYPVQHLSYANAGHRIDVPYFPASTTAGHHGLSGELNAYGGTVAGNAAANEDSWRNVLAFLGRSL